MSDDDDDDDDDDGAYFDVALELGAARWCLTDELVDLLAGRAYPRVLLLIRHLRRS